MAEIRLVKIRKRFGDNLVIKGIDLVIKEGEFFTFVGPSGCGKSTILNMIAGLEDISEGSIYFDDQKVNSLSPGDRDIAMVFQSYALYPHMSVYENIAFPLKMKKVQRSVIDEEVRKIAELLGLSQFLHRLPRELSGGQRQRVALGRAIIRRPRVFLMDEPLSNLDAKLRIEMRSELKKLHQDIRITTVYVTHDQGEAIGLSDRIAVLKDGEIQQCDTPFEIYSRPANTFVAEFIGSPPMNLVPAMVRKVDPPVIEYAGSVFHIPLKGRPEREKILMGIRPEDITISREKREGDIEVKIMVVESAGSFNWIDCLWGDITIKGMSKGSESLRPGDRCFMRFSLEKSIIFDMLSGKRI